jgi:NAD(P)-dependent dehydrogenase (short-subunit alcohol dehydrogenase family)
MSDLNGKVALVSVAARGIGVTTSQTMVDHGAEQQVFGRQAPAASVPGGEVVD